MSIAHSIPDSLAELIISDEPFFVLRASEVPAIHALREYKRQLVMVTSGDEEAVAELRELEEEFLAWQRANPDLLVSPSIVPL